MVSKPQGSLDAEASCFRMSSERAIKNECCEKFGDAPLCSEGLVSAATTNTYARGVCCRTSDP